MPGNMLGDPLATIRAEENSYKVYHCIVLGKRSPVTLSSAVRMLCHALSSRHGAACCFGGPHLWPAGIVVHDV